MQFSFKLWNYARECVVLVLMVFCIFLERQLQDSGPGVEWMGVLSMALSKSCGVVVTSLVCKKRAIGV